MSWQGKVAEEFNRSYNAPFLPEGFCQAVVEGGVLRIRLGDRDVAFDESGNAIGSGSCVGSAVEWEVKRREVPLAEVCEES